ncbi:MAG: thiolase family protein [Deltaproteobacteria bacterium]|nr:thiolase family protein [Deltaproteobacteria bacterium]
MEDVFVVASVRTAVGKLGGALRDVLPEELCRVVLVGALEKAGLEKGSVDEVIFGQTKQSTDCPNVARVASLMAGLPEEIPAYTVHRQCASGMQAIVNAAMQIQSGDGDVIVAGGVESMSTAPFYIRKARYGYLAGNGLLLDPNTESQPRSQPEDVYGHLVMGMTAENIAEKYDISREEQDEFSLRSHQKAIAAIDSGSFEDEIVPVMVPQRKASPLAFKEDESPRRETSLEKLAKLQPVFKEGGTVTAGSSSSRNDGASAAVVMSGKKVKELGLRPLARYVVGTAAGVDPRIMGIGPVPATRKALKKAGVELEQMELIELNEAFAAQSLACMRELGMNQDILNVNGGAIALGHPIGCSGSRIVTTLLHEMMKRNLRYGLATICVAGGLGMTTIFERP